MQTNTISTSDVELMTQIKNNKDEKAELLLFAKYKPFIGKYYRKLCTRLPGIDRIISFEDFSSEVYIIAFRKTIKYANLIKIKDETWKIIQIFG